MLIIVEKSQCQMILGIRNRTCDISFLYTVYITSSGTSCSFCERLLFFYSNMLFCDYSFYCSCLFSVWHKWEAIMLIGRYYFVHEQGYCVRRREEREYHNKREKCFLGVFSFSSADYFQSLWSHFMTFGLGMFLCFGIDWDSAAFGWLFFWLRRWSTAAQ